MRCVRPWRTWSGRLTRCQNGRTCPGAGEVVGRLHVACVAAGTLAQRAAGQRLIAVAIVSDQGVLLWLWWWRRAERPPALGQLLLPGAIGEEAVVADPVEAGREHVQQHPAYELGRRQRHGLVAGGAVAAVVGVVEAHGAIVEAAQALVADGDPVGVAAEGVEDLFGAGEGPSRTRPIRSCGPGADARRGGVGRRGAAARQRSATVRPRRHLPAPRGGRGGSSVRGPGRAGRSVSATARKSRP